MALSSILGANYRYSSLDTSGDPQIRLLTLFPGRFKDELCAKISIETHTDDLKYEALSYAWGKHRNWLPRHIRVSSPDSQRRRVLKISPNLEVALRHLRYENSKRTLWIDAICIDQANLQERGHQVRLMGDIYRRASRVVAWLGSATEDSTRALDFLKFLSGILELEWSNTLRLPKVVGVLSGRHNEEPHWADQKAPMSFEKFLLEYSSLQSLINRSWFERLWVRQEIGLGSPESIVQCGTDILSWKQFRDAIFFLLKWKQSHTVSLKEETQYFRRLRIVASLCFLQAARPEHLLESSRPTKCGDPRDRIYGSVNLLSPRLIKTMGINPDYMLTPAAVYTDFTKRYITAQKSLDILASARLPNSMPGLPSWVPDWSNPDLSSRPNERDVYCHASGGLHAKFQFGNLEGFHLLRATGIALGKVHHLSPLQDTSPSPDDTSVDAIGDAVFACRPWQQDILDFYQGESSALEAYCRVVTRGMFNHRLSRELDNRGWRLLTFEKAVKDLLSILSDYQLPKDHHRRYEEADSMFFGAVPVGHSSICTIEEGRLGLVPQSAQVGDLLCVFLGCSSAITLRPVSGGMGQYQVVGQSYLDGFMEGEAFLGSLPFERVWRLDLETPEVDTEFSAGFKFPSLSTEKLTWKDPRIGYLGINTARVEDTRAATREMMGSVTVEYLKKRGVRLQEFDLI
jgi:hypothetical protein